MSEDTTTIDTDATPTLVPEPTEQPPPKKPRRPRRPGPVRYGERELEVLGMISRGIKYDEVALLLDISIDTVKGHLKRVYKKLGAKSGANAVSIAIGRGMLTPAPYIPPPATAATEAEMTVPEA